METPEEDFSLELFIFIRNMHYKQLKSLLYLWIHTMLYFKNVQLRNQA